MQLVLRSAVGSPRNYSQDVLNRTVIRLNNPQNSLIDGGESGGGRNAGWRWVAPLMSLFPSSRSWKMRFHSKLSKIEESLNRENHRVLQFSGLFLGLSLYSYHVRELLICWLFFCLVFLSLGLAVLGGILAGYAGKRVTVWACAALAPSFSATAFKQAPALTVKVLGWRNLPPSMTPSSNPMNIHNLSEFP